MALDQDVSSNWEGHERLHLAQQVISEESVVCKDGVVFHHFEQNVLIAAHIKGVLLAVSLDLAPPVIQKTNRDQIHSAVRSRPSSLILIEGMRNTPVLHQAQ